MSLHFGEEIWVGYPIAPFSHQDKGLPKLQLERARFLWECCEKEVGGEDKAVKQKENWITVGTSLTLVPSASLLNCRLRFTCFPWKRDKAGNAPRSYVLRKPVTDPPAKLIYEARAERLEVPRATSFRFVTYNILAEAYIEWNNFVHTPAGSIDSNYRLSLLHAELQKYKADILCVQEADIENLQRLQAFLHQECYLAGELLNDNIWEKATVATFYNSYIFKLLKCKRILLRDEMRKLHGYGQISQANEFKRKSKKLNHVLLVTILEHKLSRCVFIIGNVHQYSNPRYPGVKLLQAMSAVKCLERELQLFKNQNPSRVTSVIFCGDFNSSPASGAVDFITSGRILENSSDWYNNKFPMKGISDQHCLKFSTAFPQGELTTIKDWEGQARHFQRCIDYIFYQEASLTLEAAYPPLSKNEISDLIGIETRKITLPNWYAPSDHMPLIADFRILC